MHELAITQAIFDTALRHAQQANAQVIRTLQVRVGALSGVVADSLQFYFELISKNTPAEGARLDVEIIPPRARCRACGVERDLPLDTETASEWPAQMQALEPCSCGQQVYELSGGLGCYLDSIDVE
jgi:hydrogenase nickel incorporation protein HypA/HybF